MQVKQITTAGSLLNTFIKITYIHIKFTSVFEFRVISVYCSIFNGGARGGIFFQCCLNLCAEFTWSVLSYSNTMPSIFYILYRCPFLNLYCYPKLPTILFYLKAVSKNTLVLLKLCLFCLILASSRTRARSWTQWSWWVLWTQHILWFCEKLASFISCYFLAFYQSLMCSNCWGFLFVFFFWL